MYVTNRVTDNVGYTAGRNNIQLIYRCVILSDNQVLQFEPKLKKISNIKDVHLLS